MSMKMNFQMNEKFAAVFFSVRSSQVSYTYFISVVVIPDILFYFMQLNRSKLFSSGLSGIYRLQYIKNHCVFHYYSFVKY